MKLLARFALILLGFAANPSFAVFHLWQMTELYSNADGSVQFLELTALSGGQQFLEGHGLVSRNANGSTSNSIQFDHNLGGDTSGRTFLVGTQGFAALGIVAPDFIVPNGFFFTGGGSIDFGEGSDRWTYGPLPGGNLSLLRNGQTAVNSPTNFNRATGSVPASNPTPTTFNVHGLWGNDPDGSEAGWGINLALHGNIIFLSWFTYDTDGTGMWLFMSSATATGPNTYSGDIFRTTGAPFSNYNASSLQVSTVGNGTLTFTDANHGTFRYTVNGITQTKQVKRFIFGPVPTCDQSGATGTNFTDLYGLAGEAGWGVNVVQQGDLAFISWFTYDANGRGMWLFGSEFRRTSASTFSGTLFRTTGSPFNNYNQSQLNVQTAGNATITWTSPSTATFNYTVGTVTQTKNIARNVHAVPATTCR